jgi:dCMP deaminase
MKTKYKLAHMQAAHLYAELSTARRLKVGALVVKDDRIISIGYNGMPKGWDNNCESVEYMNSDAGGWLDPDEIEQQWPDADSTGRYRLKTKPEVLHAETNAIAKLARSTESGLDADLFVTHSPCLDCAKLIYQSGIKRVYYANAYRNDAGISVVNSFDTTLEFTTLMLIAMMPGLLSLRLREWK